MSRRLIIAFGAGGVLATAAALVAVGFLNPSGPGPSSADEPAIPAEAYTPGEITAVVTVDPDGTLAVEETIVFDALDGSREPVVRSAGNLVAGLEEGDDDEYYRLYAEPVYSKPKGAVELVRDGEPVPLKVSTAPAGDPEADDDDAGEDEAQAETEWRLSRRDGAWPAGRHAIRFTYTVERAHVTADGSAALLVPVPRADLAGSHVDLLTVSVGGDGIAGARCQEENDIYDDAGTSCGEPTEDGFELRQTTYDEWGSGYSWNGTLRSAPRDRQAIVFDAPGLTSTPVQLARESTS